MKYKVNQELYYVCIEDDGKCTMDTYKVKTIRGSKVYAVLVAPFTWGKKSKKHGDFGWLEPIPSWCRKWCWEGEQFRDLQTTKLQAWRYTEKLIDKIYDDGEEEGIRAKKNN